MEELIAEIKRHEGFRPMAYRDTEGFLTIGYGLNLDAGVSEPLAAHILKWQINDRAKAIAGIIPFWADLSKNRQEVFINMAFNLGIPRFLKFQRMLEAARKGNVSGVCSEMKDSRWYKQVGKRADELIEKYRLG